MEPRRVNLPRESIRPFVAPQGRSVLRSPFSGARQRPLSYMSYRVVLWHVVDVPGCRESFSLPGCGAAPHTFPISQILCVPLWFFVSFVGAPQGKHSTVVYPSLRRALAARSVAVEGLSLRACTLRFLFSVLQGGASRPCVFAVPHFPRTAVPFDSTASNGVFCWHIAHPAGNRGVSANDAFNAYIRLSETSTFHVEANVRGSASGSLHPGVPPSVRFSTGQC